jgi:ABC-type branched-subunit amino acid transport system substrate-binding protein
VTAFRQPTPHSPPNRTRVHILAVLLGLNLTGCSSSAPLESSAVTLGTTLPLSAPNPGLAEAWRRGYERAVSEANRAGGVLLRSTGRRVRVLLQVRDDGGELARAQEGAQELLLSGAHALLATPGVVRMAAQATVAGHFSRPYVVPARAGPDLTATDRPWVFVAPRDGGTDEERAYLTARAALEGLSQALTFDAEAVRRAFSRE